MFYIFNRDNVCVCSCDFEPNTEDLATRGEYCKKFNSIVKIGDILQDGDLVEPDSSQIVPVIDYEKQATTLKDKLRASIDLYVLPTSTIGEDLVTEEQKATLVQDSLLLARWPSVEGWPYIDLPVLSDLTKTIIQVPVWEYPINIEINVGV